MTRVYQIDEPLHLHWCNKTTQGTALKDWRVCQQDKCPWGLFRHRTFEDGEHVLCVENQIHPRFC